MFDEMFFFEFQSRQRAQYIITQRGITVEDEKPVHQFFTGHLTRTSPYYIPDVRK